MSMPIAVRVCRVALPRWAAARRCPARVDVQTGAGECPGSQDIDQRLLVDDVAAGAVDQKGGGLHPGQHRGVDQVGVLAATGHVQEREIGDGQYLFEGCRPGGRRDAVVGLQVD